MPPAKVLAVLLSIVSIAAVQAEDSPVDYVTQVKPLLTARCTKCHGLDKQQMSLRVDSAKKLLEGGDSGPGIVPGDSAKSIIVHAITGTEGASLMPPEGDKLKPEEIDLIRRWIDQGAKAPEDEVTHDVQKKQTDHWAFHPIANPPIPNVNQTSDLQNGIDNFIRQRLEKEGITASAQAARVTLIRRASFDLIGLPPSVAEVREFLADLSPDAFERVIDRLLASPHFGERWGRDWLDAARYADSNGFTRDQPRTIWKYRDWTIDAFNENLPFDQFTIAQVAGDLLPNPSLDQLIATGFHRNTLINEEGGTDPEQFRVEATVDRVNTTSSVFLGLTIGCAQCHDHKYDPISQRDFYQLYAFYNSTEFLPGDQVAPRLDVPSPQQILAGEPERKADIRRQIAKLEQELKDQEANIAADLSAWEKNLTEEEKNKLPYNVKNAIEQPAVDRSEVHKRDLDKHFKGLPIAREKYPQLDAIGRLRESEPKFPTTMITREANPPRTTYIQVRGDFLRPGAKVEAAVPAALVPQGAKATTGNRMDLAEWLISDDNPMTARVTVNRYWQRFFGRGIVETENDFGTQGDKPTHPELLDWLASEFRRPGIRAWDIKHLHRLIVTSATYRQSSNTREELTEIDPANKLLARQSRLRVDAEMIRDAALTASGLLTEELGGPPVYPPQPEGVFDFTQDKKPWKTSTGPDRFRRAMYTHLWRSSLYPSMGVFDFPDPNVACTRRIRSNTPLQSLTLANDQTFYEFTKGFAVRILELNTQDDLYRLSYAFETAVGRTPSSSELSRLKQFLSQSRERFAADNAAAESFAPNPVPPQTTLAEAASWAAVARVLMNLDEFITRE